MNFRNVGGVIAFIIGAIFILNAIRVSGVAEEDIMTAKAIWLTIGISIFGIGYYFGFRKKDSKVSRTN